MKIGMIQNIVGTNLKENILRAQALGEDLIGRGAEYLVFPELFQCPYQNKYIEEFACGDEGRTFDMLCNLARQGAYVIGGSFPELREGKIYNSSYVFSPEGEVIGHHDKTYLYGTEVPGKFSYDEGSVFQRGDGFSVFHTEDGTFGLGICFDIRFPGPFEDMTLDGAKILFVPGAFHYSVGSHWEVLLRARAIENQVFAVGVMPGKGPGPSRNYYGHSLIADPWGKVLREFGYFEETDITEIDLEDVERIRQKLHSYRRKREDLEKDGF